MEKFQEAREKARRNLQVADHMVYVTYNVVKDPKLLLAIIENIFLSFTNSMSSVLYYDRLFKRIPAFHDNFESKLQVFKDRCMRKYGFNPIYVKSMSELKDIIVEHKKSPVEFARKDQFVICSDNYHCKTVSIDNIKKYLNQAKLFIAETNSIVSKNEEIFNKRTESVLV